jgi:hypothetical protein
LDPSRTSSLLRSSSETTTNLANFAVFKNNIKNLTKSESNLIYQQETDDCSQINKREEFSNEFFNENLIKGNDIFSRQNTNFHLSNLIIKEDEFKAKKKTIDSIVANLNKKSENDSLPRETHTPTNKVNSLKCCSFCNKNFCNKYFLRTHLAIKHSIIASLDELSSYSNDAIQNFDFFQKRQTPLCKNISWESKSQLSSDCSIDSSTQLAPRSPSSSDASFTSLSPIPQNLNNEMFSLHTFKSESLSGFEKNSTRQKKICQIISDNSKMESAENELLNSSQGKGEEQLEGYCTICNRLFCNKYYLKVIFFNKTCLNFF